MNNKMYRIIILAAACMVSAGVSVAAEDIVSLSSPNSRLSAQVYLENGEIKYNVSFDTREIIKKSSMGLSADGADKGFVSLKSSEHHVDDEYKMIGAKAAVYHNNYNEAQIDCVNGSLTIYARCYNDGFAFSYSVDNGTYVTDELTSFCVPENCIVYAAEYEDCYESRYQKSYLSELSGVYGTPLMIEEENCCVLFGEANLNSMYCGSAITANGTDTLQLDFEPKQTEPVYMNGQTPWRVIAVGSAAEIADTQIFENLCPPCKIQDTSWIKPGVSAWTWFNGDPTDDASTYKKYIDFADEMGWQYILLDEGWQPPVQNADGKKSYDGMYDWVNEVINYAESKNIGVFVWAAYWDIDTPNKQKRLSDWAAMGIKGVKIDFFNSETQEMLKLYENLAQECARLKLMVNFHGCTKPSGLRRTYPNIITCEAVHGTEHFASGEGYGATAEHNCILPFTRNAAGPMDYTPAITDYYDKHYFTNGHKAALPIVFESGIQTMADKPKRYKSSGYYNLFCNMPSSWDETKTLYAKPGEYVVIMRKKGDTIYIGSICNSQYTPDVDMSFLGEGIYRCEVYSDYGNYVRAVKREDTITLPQQLRGGTALKITLWTGDYFTDISGHWCSEYINTDIINRYFFGTFCPDKEITRAEFTLMLLYANGEKIQKGIPTFNDSKNHMFRNEINTALQKNIVSGISSTEFLPDDFITREQAAAIVGRLKNMEPKASMFLDNENISDYALGYIGACEYAGIINGYEDNTFKPKNNITRAEAAAIVSRANLLL